MSRQWQVSFVASLLLHVAAFAAVPLTMWLGHGKGDSGQRPQAMVFHVVDVSEVEGDLRLPMPDAVQVPAHPKPEVGLSAPKNPAHPRESKAPKGVSPEVESNSARPTTADGPSQQNNTTVKTLASAVPSSTGSFVGPLAVQPVRVDVPNFGEVGNPGAEMRTAVSEPQGVFVDAKPRYRLNQAPPYPPLARRRKQEGVVLLAANIDAAGTVSEVRIRESSGSRVLDESALKAVRAWEFEPARRGSTAIPSTVEIPIEFRLSP